MNLTILVKRTHIGLKGDIFMVDLKNICQEFCELDPIKDISCEDSVKLTKGRTELI